MRIRLEIAFSFKREASLADAGLDLPEGSDVRRALGELARRHPALEPRLFSPSGELRRHVNVLVNGKNVALGAGLATPLSDGDRLTLLPPVGGG